MLQQQPGAFAITTKRIKAKRHVMTCNSRNWLTFVDTHTILSREHMFTNTGHTGLPITTPFNLSMAPLLTCLLGFPRTILPLLLDAICRDLLLGRLALALQLCALFALLHHSPEIALASLASLF
jgi:hypothetical protein